MDELKTRSETEYITPTYLGIAAAWLGDLDAAFDLLQKAYDDQTLISLSLNTRPMAPLHLEMIRVFKT